MAVMDLVKIIFRNVKKTLSRYRMITPGDHVVVAVSGGGDSVCLLDILHQLSNELGVRLFVAHYDHGLRGDEDEFETQLVKGLSETMGLPFFTEKAKHLNKNVSSLEEKARESRYLFLERIRNRTHAHKIAMGHHLNDQVETVLMRLLRGSGPSGLAGIPPKRGKVIIRPLINTKQEMIMAYLQARDLPYAIDSSNKDTTLLRNKIRLELIPDLLAYQPRLMERVGRLSIISREDNDYLDHLAAQVVDHETEQDPENRIIIPISALTGLPGAIKNRIIRQLILKTRGSLRRIAYGHILSVSEIAEGNRPQATLNLPDGIIVKRSYESLIFSPALEKEGVSFDYPIHGPGSVHLESTNQIITIEEIEREIDPRSDISGLTAFMDADKIHYPLRIRNFRPGDRFIPLGMKGQKKIKDFFIDRKVPTSIRVTTPILFGRDDVLWVCGFRIDERVKITEGTKRVLKVTIGSSKRE